jgi:hypothetical protein
MPVRPVDKDQRPWNKGLLIGQKKPLEPKHVWSIRVRLEIAGSWRDLVVFTPRSSRSPTSRTSPARLCTTSRAGRWLVEQGTDRAVVKQSGWRRAAGDRRRRRRRDAAAAGQRGFLRNPGGGPDSVCCSHRRFTPWCASCVAGRAGPWKPFTRLNRHRAKDCRSNHPAIPVRPLSRAMTVLCEAPHTEHGIFLSCSLAFGRRPVLEFRRHI